MVSLSLSNSGVGGGRRSNHALSADSRDCAHYLTGEGELELELEFEGMEYERMRE
jgi:hypothetical protein